MRIFVTVLTTALIAATSAMAAAPRISGPEYLRMSRCAGLMAGAGHDSSAMDAAILAASEGRDPRARDASRYRRRAAQEQMRAARSADRARLEAELSTRCALPAG